MSEYDLVHGLHTFIIGPLFVYGGFFATDNYDSKAFFTSLILYSGFFSLIYHGISFAMTKKKEKKPTHLLHLALGSVFVMLGYQYWINNKIPNYLLQVIGTFGLMALLYHSYAWFSKRTNSKDTLVQ